MSVILKLCRVSPLYFAGSCTLMLIISIKSSSVLLVLNVSNRFKAYWLAGALSAEDCLQDTFWVMDELSKDPTITRMTEVAISATLNVTNKRNRWGFSIAEVLFPRICQAR